MSDSKFIEVELSARARPTDPEAALRAALSSVGKDLAGRGGAPFHFTEMEWKAPDPAALDPKRIALDLCYREVFGGFRPPITVTLAAGDQLIVRARARIPQAAPSEPVWHGLSRPELAREYSPRGQVADMGALFAQWSKDGAAFRAGYSTVDIAYGSGAFETFDFFRPTGIARPPLWVFIHGGYWQASDKFQHAQFAAGMLAAGFAVANVNYGLCPDVTLETIVARSAPPSRFSSEKPIPSTSIRTPYTSPAIRPAASRRHDGCRRQGAAYSFRVAAVRVV